MNEPRRTASEGTTRRERVLLRDRDRSEVATRGRYLAYAACAWAILFAIPNLYWAAGGTAGAGTIGGEIEERALERETGMIVILWASGLLKLAGAVFALALTQPWGERLPRRLMTTLGIGGGMSMVLYGVSLTVQHGLMLANVIDRAESLDATALRWHLFFWNPIWILGGLLFTLATWYFMRRTAPPRAR